MGLGIRAATLICFEMIKEEEEADESSIWRMKAWHESTVELHESALQDTE